MMLVNVGLTTFAFFFPLVRSVDISQEKLLLSYSQGRLYRFCTISLSLSLSLSLFLSLSHTHTHTHTLSNLLVRFLSLSFPLLC